MTASNPDNLHAASYVPSRPCCLRAQRRAHVRRFRPDFLSFLSLPSFLPSSRYLPLSRSSAHTHIHTHTLSLSSLSPSSFTKFFSFPSGRSSYVLVLLALIERSNPISSLLSSCTAIFLTVVVVVVIVPSSTTWLSIDRWVDRRARALSPLSLLPSLALALPPRSLSLDLPLRATPSP